jgi:cyanate lyase
MDGSDQSISSCQLRLLPPLQLANELGLSNVYVAMLLHGQHQLQPHTAPALKAALPQLSNEDLKEMQRAPARRSGLPA